MLSPDEIAAFWKALDSRPAGMPRRCAIALMLELVTAQRKGEVVGAEWSEMDREQERVWVIPAEKAKNGLAHRVPLSDLALSLLAELKPLSGGSKWLFPSPKADRPMEPRAVNHAVLRVIDKLGVGGDMTPHDLRRSAASHMTGMGISRFVVARILNHVERGVTAVYDRYSYDREKRQALDAWARRVTAIIAGEREASNVYELARA